MYCISVMSTTFVEHSLISKNNEVQNHDGKKDEVKLNKQMRTKILFNRNN